MFTRMQIQAALPITSSIASVWSEGAVVCRVCGGLNAPALCLYIFSRSTMGCLQESDALSWPETNSIRFVLPPGMDPKISIASFKMFGEVASCKVGKDKSSALIVFYDVRAAAKTLQALGEGPFIQPGPQTGNRRVCLPGDADLTTDDVAGVSRLSQNKDAGTYTVEFYDIRDAERVRKALVPKQHLPTSKEIAAEPVSVDCGPALPRATPFYHNVMIHGLPNALLSEMMMEAMMQQAGVDGVANFSAKLGKACGEAVVSFYSYECAQKCMTHFHGRQWDGCRVSTWMVSEGMEDEVRKRKDTESTAAPGSEDGEDYEQGLQQLDMPGKGGFGGQTGFDNEPRQPGLVQR